MIRRPTTQDISWFLDLNRNKQLDLDPSYQRRSVWTLKDRKFFLDSIFRDYPCPAIFLFKETDESGKQIYHVVDGKQRLETILSFVNNKIIIDKAFGDSNLDGKKWNALSTESKKKFWNYVLSVEFIDSVDGRVVNDVFDRLNRNSWKLHRQELRHAKYEGWFIKIAETEAEKDEWETLGIATKARAKRMKDVQFISELLIVILKGEVVGFDQLYLDEFYALYDAPNDVFSDFSEDDFHENLEAAKKYLLEMNACNSAVTTHAKGFGDFLSLWTLAVLSKSSLPAPSIMAEKYSEFMDRVSLFKKSKEPEEEVEGRVRVDIHAYTYFRNSVGASTDQAQREARYKTLTEALLAE